MSLLSLYVFSKHLYLPLGPSYVWAYEEIKDYFQYCLLDVIELNCKLIPY
jgi:hypothetical protein